MTLAPVLRVLLPSARMTSPVEENLALLRRMSPFWEPRMAVPVIQWLKDQQVRRAFFLCRWPILARGHLHAGVAPRRRNASREEKVAVPMRMECRF